MDDHDAERVLREQFTVRIGPHMSQFVANTLNSGAVKQLNVMGGDARTGIPVYRTIPAAQLNAAAAATDAPNL